MNSTKKVRTKLKTKSTSIIDPNNNLDAQTTTLTHLFIKAKKTDHLKDTTINKYYNSIASPNNNTKPTPSIPSETKNKIAYGTLYNNNDPDDNIPISTVVIQDSLYKHNSHHGITSQIPSELLISKFTATESTAESERKTFTKKNVPTIPNQKVHRTLPHPNNPNRHTCSFANSRTKTKTTPSSHKPYPMYQQQN